MEDDWYKNWFGNEYLTVYAHRDENEADSVIKLLHSNVQLSKKSLILDLCCGQGRHVHKLAQQGYHVIGMDLSRTLLTIAKYKSVPQDNAWFVQADMRNLPVKARFDLLLNLFTSFGYFQSDSENLAVLKQFNSALKSKGSFIFDFFNAIQVEANLVAEQTDLADDLIIKQKRKIENERVNKKITLTKNNQKSVYYESVRMYHPDELYRMMAEAGLKVLKVFGDYDGSSFAVTSPRLIMIGEKIG